MTLFRSAVETAVSRVRKLLGTGGVPISLTLFVLAMAHGLIGLYGPERTDELFIGTRPHFSPWYLRTFRNGMNELSPSLINPMVSVDAKRHDYLLY